MSDQIREPMTYEEFFDYVAQHPDKHFDFIDGELVEVSPTPFHGYIQAELALIIGIWLKANPGKGFVHTETLHVVDTQNRLPDVSVNSQRSKTQAFFDVPPLLAVEIRSDTQSRPAQRRKAMEYIKNGTPVVLVVMPDEQIEMFTQETQEKAIIFKAGETVTDIPGFPGLKIDIDDLFAWSE